MSILDVAPVLHECHDCHEHVMILHQRAGGGAAVICGACQGKANRIVIDGVRHAIQTLKSSLDSDEQRDAVQTLRDVVGIEQADAAVRVIFASREAGKYSKFDGNSAGDFPSRRSRSSFRSRGD